MLENLGIEWVHNINAVQTVKSYPLIFHSSNRYDLRPFTDAKSRFTHDLPQMNPFVLSPDQSY